MAMIALCDDDKYYGDEIITLTAAEIGVIVDMDDVMAANFKEGRPYYVSQQLEMEPDCEVSNAGLILSGRIKMMKDNVLILLEKVDLQKLIQVGTLFLEWCEDNEDEEIITDDEELAAAIQTLEGIPSEQEIPADDVDTTDNSDGHYEDNSSLAMID